MNRIKGPIEKAKMASDFTDEHNRKVQAE